MSAQDIAHAAAAAPPARTRRRWVQPPHFMMRVGGLPFDIVEGLRAPAAVAWAEQAMELEHRLALDKDRLADRLQDRVGGITDDAGRRAVLALRRDVYNLRLPTPRAIEQATAVLEPQVAELLADWVRVRHELHELFEQGDRVLAEALTSTRDHLKQVAESPQVRQGLLLASSSVDRYLPAYTQSSGAPSKRLRRMERSLLEYVYRTACKTSPFSSFTPVALGRFAPDVGSLLELASVGEDWTSHTRLNLAVLARVVEVVHADPALRGDLPVELTQGWLADHDRIRYVRRQRQRGDDDATVTMDTLRESLIYLGASSVLQEVFDALPDGGRMRLSDLVRRLTTGGAEVRDPDEVQAYLGHLVRLGLLVTPSLHIDIHHPDPFGCFVDAVAALDRPWADHLAERLTSVAESVRAYDTASLAQRRGLLDRIRLDVTEAQLDAGAQTTAVPRTLLYEDVTLPTTPRIDTQLWEQELRPALTAFTRVLPAFDITLPQRLVTAGYFRARYGAGGRCTDVVNFMHDFHQDFYDQYLRSSMQRREFDEQGEYLSQINWLHQPEVTALDDARRAVISQMRSRYAEHADDDVELVLDDAFISDIADRLPEPTGRLDPHCFFLQVGRSGESPFAVLNRAYSGLTLQFSRFAHCFPGHGEDGLVAGLRSTLAQVSPSGAVFAEITGGYETTNLNLHPTVTPYEIVCPGDVSHRPAAEQIPVDDLMVIDEGGRLQLRSQRLDREVVPVYLGFLVPLALPEIQQMLLRFSATSMARIDLWNGVDRPLGDRLIGGHPRVRYDNLVLSRRLWKTRPDVLPIRGDRSDAESFLAWSRWRHEHGLPRRAFVTPDVSTPTERNEDPGGRPVAVGTTKPRYVDFDSPLSLASLEATTRTATHRMVFTEMLPDPDQMWLRPDGHPRVSELTIELDGIVEGES